MTYSRCFLIEPLLPNDSRQVLPSAADVLEVLTEVDEKSRRSPEIIQYFIVSQNQTRKSREAAAGELTPV